MITLVYLVCIAVASFATSFLHCKFRKGVCNDCEITLTHSLIYTQATWPGTRLSYARQSCSK